CEGRTATEGTHMAGFWHLGDARTGRRRLAAAGTAVVTLVAVTAGVVAYGRGGDDRSGLAMTAVGQGTGVAVPPDLPSPEELLAAVQAASAAADAAAPDAPGASATTPAEAATMPDPPIAPPVLPGLPGFPATEPGTDQALVTLVNDYPGAVTVKLNGQSYALAEGEHVGPVEVTLTPNGNDVVEMALTAEPTCGQGDAGGYFQPGGTYLLTVTAGPGMCMVLPAPGTPAPGVRVTAT
ncbi:MAG: hypothetical protein ACR2HV_01730, partial [Acidimicrobiales bacterium]